ncbi:unnamed protein product [Pleuronectes platessa]|uniref:Uncharacterized protein n=1 Tax=Pleuronectes platessa TaxID=8262 RepID=A0A9N7TJ64_PLEPL|nr:unnamed protein product [Pleuronectes platessa]
MPIRRAKKERIHPSQRGTRFSGGTRCALFAMLWLRPSTRRGHGRMPAGSSHQRHKTSETRRRWETRR